MALDLLTIPAMSADAERIFSGCRIQMSYRCNRLSIKTLEALELLKSWMNLANWDDNDVATDENNPLCEGIDKWTYPNGSASFGLVV
jgi:hypothetical protein